MMLTEKTCLAVLMDVLRLPFSPLIELPDVFTDLDLATAVADGTGSRADRQRVEFNARLEALYREREPWLERLDRGDISEPDLGLLRQLAARFRSLGNDYQDDDNEGLNITRQAADQLEGWAQEVEAAFREGGPPPGTSANAMPHPKLLTALDRLGFNLDKLGVLTQQQINQNYKERARRFHPDTKDAGDKAFYEEQMKNLNEARDLLLQTAR